MENQTFIESIISQIRGTINQFAFNRMTENAYLDPEKVLQEMRKYGDKSLGAYASRNFFSL